MVCFALFWPTPVSLLAGPRPVSIWMTARFVQPSSCLTSEALDTLSLMSLCRGGLQKLCQSIRWVHQRCIIHSIGCKSDTISAAGDQSVVPRPFHFKGLNDFKYFIQLCLIFTAHPLASPASAQ